MAVKLPTLTSQGVGQIKPPTWDKPSCQKHQLFNSSEKRLARLLLLMANFGQESKPMPLVVKMSQETIAEMIGTTRSRVSYFMNRFRELGFIDYGGDGIHVHRSLVS